jgi:glutamate racemase
MSPLGVFDSGLGGLTVVREVRRVMPAETFVYVGDSAKAPYGPRPADEIRALSLGQARFLLERFGCRGLVIACNTATAAAAEAVRAAVAPMPVVAMEPAVKPAAAATRTGVVGVLATVGTLSSARFAALLARHDDGGRVRFLTTSCPGWVEAVEQGRTTGPEAYDLVARYVKPLVAAGADALVLGCTHFPALRPLIEEAAGPGVAVLDVGAAVARRAAQVFPPTEETGEGGLLLHTTGDPAAFAGGAQSILGLPDLPPVRRLYWNGPSDTLSAERA